ncbi:MAG TPA: flagellar protein FliS [Candidatus Marinimicrobia bacterium]|nr:flagellar protein FliS [Candidatus Neomarinimicrobiota bacterium]
MTLQRRNQSITNPYQRSRVMTASPEQLILYVYDAAVNALQRQDRIRSLEAVNLLVSSLRYEHRDLAMSFYRLYDSVQRQIMRGNYGLAQTILREMRETWRESMELN